MADTASVYSMASSRSSRSSKASRYRTVASAATVDESLFATKPAKQKKEEPDFIEVLTKDSIRKLRARKNQQSKNDSPTSRTILSRSDYERIKRAAHVLSKEDEAAMRMEIKREKAQALEESTQRKMKLEKFEAARQRKQMAESKHGTQNTEKNNSLLRKAQEQMDEEEDEIKHLNELIIYAKCVAIRDAQVAEKKIIKKERQDEDWRLDVSEERIRQQNVKLFEQRELERHEERCRGAEVIRQQILGREEQRHIDQEIRDQETIALLQHLEKVKQDEYIMQMKKKEAQLNLMKDVEQANHECKQRKIDELVKDKLEDEKIVEYMKEKDHREAVVLEEAEAKRVEREKEIARIRAQQERSQDQKKAQDALRAKRAIEDYERQAREKELTDASDRASLINDLNSARSKQIQDQLRFTAMQAHRDRAEFERQVALQQKHDSKEALKMEALGRARKQHNVEVKEQIEEKRSARFAERKAFFQAGVDEERERGTRNSKIDAIKQRKIEELRELGVGNKYVSYVEREAFSKKAPSFSSTVGAQNLVFR